MKKLLLVGLLLSGMSVHAADGGGRPSGLVAPKCRTCKKFKGPDFGIRNCQCGQPAADSAAVSAPDASRMPRVKTGGSVQSIWKPGGPTQAERDIRSQEDEKFAQGLAGVPVRDGGLDLATQELIEQIMLEDFPDQIAGGYDPDAATQQAIADMLAADLAAQEAQQALVDEMTARQVAAEQGAQAYKDRQEEIKRDAKFAVKLAQQQQFLDAIGNLKAAFDMTDLSPADRASIEDQIAELEAQLFSLGL